MWEEDSWCGWEQQDAEEERQEYEVRSWLKSADAKTIHDTFDIVCGGSDKAIELYDQAFRAALSGQPFDLKDEILYMLLNEYTLWEKEVYK